MSTQLTTAQVLGRLRTELIAEDMPPELVDDLVRDAAHVVFVDNGFGVQA